MIYMWLINYYKLAVEKDRDSIFTTITTVWKQDLCKNGVNMTSSWFRSLTLMAAVIYTLNMLMKSMQIIEHNIQIRPIVNCTESVITGSCRQMCTADRLSIV